MNICHEFKPTPAESLVLVISTCSMKLTKENLEIIKRFIQHCAKELGLRGKITITLSERQTTGMPTAGYCDPYGMTVFVAIKNRAMADCLRTLAHELTHCKQGQAGVVFPNDDEGLQPYEDAANANSGQLVRFWGRENPEIYADLSL